MTSVKAWRCLFALLILIVTWQTLTPDPADTKPSMAIARWISEILFGDDRLGDKVAHFMAYAALGGSAALAHLRLFGRRTATAIALALYGAALEAMQGLGGVRAPELVDALANMLGVISAFPAAWLIEDVLSRKRRT